MRFPAIFIVFTANLRQGYSTGFCVALLRVLLHDSFLKCVSFQTLSRDSHYLLSVIDVFSLWVHATLTVT